jgi:hypothetical protein
MSEPATPDDTLELRDEGIELPEWLRGYSGQFTLRTADVTGTMTTTDAGLPDEEFYDGVIAVYPDDDGDYNDYLREGLLSFETPDHREVVYEVVDERTEDPEEGDA